MSVKVICKHQGEFYAVLHWFEVWLFNENSLFVEEYQNFTYF